MIIGTVIGAQFGPIGAAVGAGTFMLWGVITGDVPFEGGRRNAPPPGRGGGTARGSDEEMENEVDDELKKKQDLEAEIEAELKHQEELLAAINKQEETNKTLQQEAKDCANADTPADPTAAPKRPCQRDIPDQIFDTKTVKENKQERIVKTLDADRDGKPEIKITIDPKSGAVLTREEDTDFDGKLDATNTYLPDGRLDVARRGHEPGRQARPLARLRRHRDRRRASRSTATSTASATATCSTRTASSSTRSSTTTTTARSTGASSTSPASANVEIEDTTLDGVMDTHTFFDDKGRPAASRRTRTRTASRTSSSTSTPATRARSSS